MTCGNKMKYYASVRLWRMWRMCVCHFPAILEPLDLQMPRIAQVNRGNKRTSHQRLFTASSRVATAHRNFTCVAKIPPVVLAMKNDGFHSTVADW